MKKFVSLILVCMLSLAVFASCAKPGQTTTGETSGEPLEGQDLSYVTPDEIKNDASKIAVTGITTDSKSFECAENSMFVLKASVMPENATYKDVIYISSDEEVVSYNEELAAFFASANGTARVKIMTKDGGYYTTVIVKVGTGVKEVKTTDPKKLTGIRLSVTETELGVGDNMYITVNPIPSTATVAGGVTWTTTDETVAYVETTAEGSYVLYGVSAGDVTITAKSATGDFTATIKVKVNGHEDAAVSGVSLDTPEKTLKVGESFTLTATVKPSSAVNKFTIWMSSDDKVAEVSSDGTVTAVAPGTVTITVMTIEGGFTAECTVTVK